MKINSGQAPSTLVPKYIGSDFDQVVTVGQNIEDVKTVAGAVEDVGVVVDNLGSVTTVATNIGDVVSVSDNMSYVQDVAAGITGLPVISYIGEEPPTQPAVGATWYCTLDGRSYVWYTDADSSQWVENSPQSRVLHITAYTGKTPPPQPEDGTTWYCSRDGRNYIWYVNADSSQWVESSPQSGSPASIDKMTLNAAATDVVTTIALINQIRAGLIANGLAQ